MASLALLELAPADGTANEQVRIAVPDDPPSSTGTWRRRLRPAPENRDSLIIVALMALVDLVLVVLFITGASATELFSVHPERVLAEDVPLMQLYNFLCAVPSLIPL